MSMITQEEFIRLILNTQSHLEEHGFPAIVDGPRWIKDLYDVFQRTGTYSDQERFSLQETKEYARSLLTREKEIYGDEDFRTWTIKAQLTTLEKIETEIPVEDMVYALYGIDVFKLYNLAQEVVNREKAEYCELLQCTEEELPAKISEEVARASLTPEEARLFLKEVKTIVKTKLRKIFSEEEIGETEIKEVSAVEIGYNEPVAIGKSRVSISFISGHMTPTALLNAVSHESVHTIGYGMQMRSGKKIPENSAILLNTLHVPFQEGIANGIATLMYPSAEALMEEINPLLPPEKELDLFMATQHIIPVRLNRAHMYIMWFDRFIRGVSEKEILEKTQKVLGYKPEKTKAGLAFMEKWTYYYPTYIVADIKIIPELQKALAQSPQELYEKVREFAIHPDLEVLQ